MKELHSNDLEATISSLGDCLRRSTNEKLPLLECAGRVLAEPIVADRDSPPADMSAMDGYALTMADLQRKEPIPFSSLSVPGREPPTYRSGHAMQVFTGGIVPSNYDLVIKREDTIEEPGSLTLREYIHACQGQPEAMKLIKSMKDNIRRKGENAKKGSVVIAAGTLLTGAQLAVAANFGAAVIEVSRRLRVSILTTGDELKGVDESVEPWQLRDSNGPTLHGLLQRHQWLNVAPPQRVGDQPERMESALSQLLENADAVLLTGGVSMGDFDYVPQSVVRVGGAVIFHKLPIRPGRPMLGGVGPAGQLMLGLPGNPVSAAIGSVRFAIPLLARMAGLRELSVNNFVELVNPDDRKLPLEWFRLVRTRGTNSAELVTSLGSGDLVSLSQSTGFVHIPANQVGVGPWKYWSWE